MNRRLTERAIKRLEKIIEFAKTHRWHRDPCMMIADKKGDYHIGDWDTGYSYCGEGFFLAPTKGGEDITLCFLREKVQEVIDKRLKNKVDYNYGTCGLSEYSDYEATSKRCVVSLFETAKKNLERELQDA
jgi:hypothetical protein